MGKTRFLYHACATGLSGTITRPFEELLEVQAASALSPHGGYSSARKENIRIRETFTAAKVHSETVGSFNEKGNSYDTSATATVERFNLSDVVTAEIVTARISSSHRADEDVEPPMILDGTSFQNLRIAGRKIELESLVGLFSELNTMSKLRARYSEDDGFRTRMEETSMVGRHGDLTDVRLHKFFPWRHREPGKKELPEFRNRTILPLFRILNKSEPGFTVMGNVVYVKNFGRVHVGDVSVKEYERSVTALHVDLGSPTEGSMEAASVVCNGSTDGPPVEG